MQYGLTRGSDVTNVLLGKSFITNDGQRHIIKESA